MRLLRLIILSLFLCSLSFFSFANDKYVKVTTNAVGEGKVYAKITSPTSSPTYTANTFSTTGSVDAGATSQANTTAYIYAKPNDNYVFDKWTDGSSWSSYQKNASVPVIAKGSSSSPTSYTFTATFKQKGLVSVSSSDETKGVVSLSGTNSEGNAVTITAIENVFKGKFAHWLGPNGEVVAVDPVYSFTITGSNSGNYVAVFDSRDVSKGFYIMLYNELSSKYLGLLGDNDDVDTDQRFFQHSILLADANYAYSSPAFVLKMTGTADDYFNLSNIDLAAQGTSIKSNPAASSGNLDFLRVKDGSYQIKGTFYSNVGFMKYETSTGNGIPVTKEEHYGNVYHPGAFNGASLTDTHYFWKIAVLTEDEHTHCFGAEPKSSVTFQEKYFTTMYTAFPYKCLDGVNAFIVDRINNNGTIHLKKITSGIVPAKTPVILQCNTTNPKTNRLLPLLDNVSNISGTNFLKGEIWIKDYTKNESSYRTAFSASTMRVLNNASCAFKNVNNEDILGTTGNVGTLSYIQNNTCYLNIETITSSNRKDQYTFEVPEMPLIQPASQSSLEGLPVVVTINCPTQGAVIKYSTDGENWLDYQSGTQISVLQNTTIRAKAIDSENGFESDIATATYTFTALSAPSITPTSAEAEVGETLTFTATNPNGGSSTMQYCIDGGAWTTTTGTITLNSTEAKTGKVEVKVVNGNAESPVATATYTFAEDYEDITLHDLINMPVGDTKYNITDTCIYVIDNAGLLICKDKNGYASKDVAESGWIDYMQQVSGLNPGEYDQSNWIALRLPQGTSESPSNDKILTQLTGVKGHLVNATNLEFQLDEMPQFGSRVEFTPNTYIPASFKGTQESANGKTYFFVQPKPMEYAHIEWAVSRGDKFVTAPRDLEHGINTAGLSGEFEFNGMYLGDFGLEWDHVYMMDALIKRYTDNFDHVYVMGNVDGLVFDSRKGVEMYTADGKVYTATVTVSNAANNVNGFFGFTKELGATWESIAGYRYGANENNKYVTSGTYDIDIVQGTNSFAILPGTYALTLNMETGKLTIATASANAPRRADAQSTARYIVYPVNLTETSNSIITGVMNVAGAREVAAVEYVNLAGQRSSRPWQGVNIVVTRYTDGTVTTAKECK